RRRRRARSAPPRGGPQKHPHTLRVGALGASGRADKVAEEHGDNLSLLASLCRRGFERGRARAAEAEALRVLLAAARARDHTESVRRIPFWLEEPRTRLGRAVGTSAPCE